MKNLFVLSALICLSFTSSNVEDKLNGLVNNWHKAASNANFSEYFNSMSDDFIFLGTAPNERWNKTEFANFSKPYFDKGKAWDFKPSNRKWIIKKNIAWFDEDLDTWMNGCRGSGILEKQKGEWKLVYYNLTVLIENEKIKEFIKLRE